MVYINPATIRDWNVLPASTASLTRSSEDSVSRFVTLVRFGEESPLVKECHSTILIQ